MAGKAGGVSGQGGGRAGEQGKGMDLGRTNVHQNLVPSFLILPTKSIFVPEAYTIYIAGMGKRTPIGLQESYTEVNRKYFHFGRSPDCGPQTLDETCMPTVQMYCQ